MGERPVSDPEKQIRDPPQLAQAGIFDYLQEDSVFAIRSHQDGVILG